MEYPYLPFFVVFFFFFSTRSVWSTCEYKNNTVVGIGEGIMCLTMDLYVVAQHLEAMEPNHGLGSLRLPRGHELMMITRYFL